MVIGGKSEKNGKIEGDTIMAKQRVRFSKSTHAIIIVLALLITISGAFFTGQFKALFGEKIPGDALQVHIIDVGNADAIYVTQGGKNMLIDAGVKAAESTISEYLRAQNVKKLDIVIATHADADHIGGMVSVLNNFEIGTFIMAFMPEEHTPTSATYERLMETVDAMDNDGKLTFREAVVGDSLKLGTANLDILGPVGDFNSNNDQSVVCRVSYGETRFLFMGDAEKDAENALLERWADLRADFIKVGHHGSNTSSQTAFLDKVQPTYAAITCGSGNSYGHPKPELLKRLEGVEVLRSDLDGHIVAISDGRNLTVKTQKKGSS